MKKAQGKQDGIFLFTSRGKVFFLALSLGFAVLLFLLYFPFVPLQKIGGAAYLVFYYAVQLLKLSYLFVAFGFMFVFARREGLKSGLSAYLYYLSFELLFQLLNLFVNIGEYPDEVLVINLFATFFSEGLRMLLLFIIPYLLFLRGVSEETGVSLFSFSSRLSSANIALALLFFLVRMIEQIYETVTFIEENCYGLPSLLTSAEIGSIVFDFVFIPLSLTVAFFVIWFTERRLLQKIEA